MAKNEFRLYDEDGNFIEEFTSIIKFMEKYKIPSNVRIYKSINEGSTFIFNKNHKDKRYRVERITKKKTPNQNLTEDNKRIIYEVDSRACTINRTTRLEMAEKYDYSVSYIGKLVRDCKQVAPGVYLIQHWYDTWEYL